MVELSGLSRCVYYPALMLEGLLGNTLTKRTNIQTRWLVLVFRAVDVKDLWTILLTRHISARLDNTAKLLPPTPLPLLQHPCAYLHLTLVAHVRASVKLHQFRYA